MGSLGAISMAGFLSNTGFPVVLRDTPIDGEITGEIWSRDQSVVSTDHDRTCGDHYYFYSPYIGYFLLIEKELCATAQIFHSVILRSK